MPTKDKKIDFFQISIKDWEGVSSSLNFEDIVSHQDVKNADVRLKGKDLELKIYKNDPEVIVGILETSRNTNVPPKKSKRLKKLSRLGLSPDEGLAYGNVFLYDKKRNILMYEVNKFGSYLDHFINFIYLALKKADSNIYKKFKIKTDIILTPDEYNRIISMIFHKSIELQIAQPNKIIDDLNHKNDALLNICKSANELNSSRLTTKFEVESKKYPKGFHHHP